MPANLIRTAVLASVILTAVAVAAEPPQVETRESGPLYFENVPEIPASVSDALRPYLKIRSATAAGWLPDGGMLVRTRFDETDQLFRVRAPGSRREQLTFFAEPVTFATPSPDAKRARVLLLRDAGGSEDYQVLSLDLDDGGLERITDGDSRNGAVAISRAGDRAAYFSTRRNGRDWDIFIADLETGAERMAYRAEGAWVPLEWGPEDRRLLILHVVSSAESYPWVLELASGETRRVSLADEAAAFRQVRFGRNANEVVFVSDTGRDVLSLFARDLESGETRLLVDETWPVTEFDVHPDGSEVVYVLNRDGFGELHRIDLETGQPLDLPEVPAGVISAPEYDPAGQNVAFTLSSWQVPGDVFSVSLDSGAVTRWTYSEAGGLDVKDFRAPELVRYPTFDEVDDKPRRIPAWVYRPAGDGPHPVVVDIHGGPAAQRRPSFSSVYQHWLAELGVAVVVPNVRGSSGYGKEYLALDDTTRREDSVRDIGALLDWIDEAPDLDADRVAVYGGSYGGYMVLSSLMHYGDRLAGGVNIVGISNFVTFLENTRDYRRDLRRAEYGDERDPDMREFLHNISPANHPERLDSPLLVVQGLNDPRVPASESEQVLAAMRAAGHDPWYLMARNEGHGFRRQSNRQAQYETTAVFLAEVLGLELTR